MNPSGVEKISVDVWQVTYQYELNWVQLMDTVLFSFMVSMHVKNESHQHIPAQSTDIRAVRHLPWVSILFLHLSRHSRVIIPGLRGTLWLTSTCPLSMRCLEGGGGARSSTEPGKDSLQTQTSTTSLQNVCTLEEIKALCAAAKVSLTTVPPVVVMLFKKNKNWDQGSGNPLVLSDIGPDDTPPPSPIVFVCCCLNRQGFSLF